MKFGQHVTVMVKNGVLAYGTWQVKNGGHVRLTRRFHRSAATAVLIRFEEEGITWIRGWHDENSDEGRALLAAHVMAATPLADLREQLENLAAGLGRG